LLVTESKKTAISLSLLAGFNPFAIGILQKNSVINYKSFGAAAFGGYIFLPAVA
jgi:hypothetical protein